MINISFYKKNGIITGFTVKNHGSAIVCAAVSALTINCCNSLDLLAKAPVALTSDEKRGIIDLRLNCEAKDISENARLLLSAFELGVKSVANENKKHVTVTYLTV